ncbi:uncharacterized protein LOC127351690 [Dicentrarchus labrax]|uniref:uncharacterized protein LOC127351690 n=1 Tax=Dicentrarchus labrax TaxID=13489 RepID=UPI0021F52E76|nr:uncharacterized protein LOC127351690 [Dicentrarchus labrax]
MSRTDCFRLFVLCLWLLVGDVNCENAQKGYVRRVEAGPAPMGVQNDNQDYKSSEAPFYRISADGRYPYPVIPEPQNSQAVPKSQFNDFKSGSSSTSVAQGQSAVQVPSHIYRARTQPVQAHRAPVGVGPNNRKALFYPHSSTASPNIQAIKSSLKSQKIYVNPSGPNIRALHPQESPLTPRSEVGGYRPAYVFPNGFNRDRTDLLQKVLKPIDKKMESIVKGHSPGGNSAGKVDTRMSYPIWSPRVYSSDGMSQARGYAHVRHLKPGCDKTRPQASSAASMKFWGTDFTSAKQNQGSSSRHSTGSFGHGVLALNERRLNLNHNSRGREPGSWHSSPSDRAQIPVQGKFKPFQRLPMNDLPAQTNSSDSETAPTQTTLPPSLNCTGITTSVNGTFSTKTALPTQTEGQDPELVPQASNPEDQTESSAEVGTSLKQNNTTVSPPKLQPAEKETS